VPAAAAARGAGASGGDASGGVTIRRALVAVLDWRLRPSGEGFRS